MLSCSMVWLAVCLPGVCQHCSQRPLEAPDADGRRGCNPPPQVRMASFKAPMRSLGASLDAEKCIHVGPPSGKLGALVEMSGECSRRCPRIDPSIFPQHALRKITFGVPQVADLLPKEIPRSPPVALSLRRRRCRFRSTASHLDPTQCEGQVERASIATTQQRLVFAPAYVPFSPRTVFRHSWHSGAPRLLSCSCTMCGTSGVSKYSHHSNAWRWLYIMCRCLFLPRVFCVVALPRRFRSWLCLDRLRVAIRAGRGHLPDRAVLRGLLALTLFSALLSFRCSTSPILFLHYVWGKWCEQAQSPEQRLVLALP